MKILPCFSIAPLLLFLCFPLLTAAQSVDKATGLAIGAGFDLVKTHCTACHSAKLVTQNRMSRETWLETIRWMQKSQGLWSLGPAENNILDYLEKNYSPLKVGRRKVLPPELMPPK